MVENSKNNLSKLIYCKTEKNHIGCKNTPLHQTNCHMTNAHCSYAVSYYCAENILDKMRYGIFIVMVMIGIFYYYKRI